MDYKGYKNYKGHSSYKDYDNYKGYSSYKGYEDYKELDVTKETASEKELRKLKKKYGVDRKCGTSMIEIVVCLLITFILTVAIILLYGNVIKLSIDFIVDMFIVYFGILSIVVLSISRIIQKINAKWYIFVVLLEIDALICMTSVVIANIVPIGGTLQIIMPIIGMTSFALFVPLMYMVAKFEPKK